VGLIFFGFVNQPPIISEVSMNDALTSDSHRRRRLAHVPFPVATLTPATEPDEIIADIRTLLDYMDGEYVGPEITRTLRRLRGVVGSGA
jgi:hypothetical protein